MAEKTVVIVEDEALIAEHIAGILEGAGYKVLDIFDESPPLFAFLNTQKPDVLLLDIHLNGDLDGVDIAHEVNARYRIPILFLTSNTDRRTMERVKGTMPLSFVAKPYTAEGLLSNLEIALHRLEQQPEIRREEPPSLSENALFVKDKSTLIKVFFQEISHVQALDNYAIIFTLAGKKYVVPHTLKRMEEDLAAHGFIKTHRSYLVNGQHISSIHPRAVMIGDTEIPMSEGQREDVLARVKTL